MPTIGKQSGFTLIELLVVISIIGMLASIVLVSVSKSKSNATDTVRISNVREIQKAIYAAYPNFQTAPIPKCNDSGYAGGCEVFTLPDGSTVNFDSSRDGTFMEFLRPQIGDIGHLPADTGVNYYVYARGEWPVGSGVMYKYIIGVVLDNSSNPAMKQSINAGYPGYENYYTIGEQ